MTRNRDKMPDANAEMQVICLDARGAYIRCSTVGLRHSCGRYFSACTAHSITTTRSQILHWSNLQSVYGLNIIFKNPKQFFCALLNCSEMCQMWQQWLHWENFCEVFVCLHLSTIFSLTVCICLIRLYIRPAMCIVTTDKIIKPGTVTVQRDKELHLCHSLELGYSTDRELVTVRSGLGLVGFSF